MLSCLPGSETESSNYGEDGSSGEVTAAMAAAAGAANQGRDRGKKRRAHRGAHDGLVGGLGAVDGADRRGRAPVADDEDEGDGDAVGRSGSNYSLRMMKTTMAQLLTCWLGTGWPVATAATRQR